MLCAFVSVILIGSINKFVLMHFHANLENVPNYQRNSSTCIPGQSLMCQNGVLELEM